MVEMTDSDKTLAYYSTELITTVKSFIVQTQGNSERSLLFPV